MREIKFRAWWKAEKKMLHNVQNFYDTLGQEINGNDDEPEQSFYGILDNPGKYVVEQYTGLKDKHGVEIYEGDIINHWVWLGTSNGGSGIEKRVVEYGWHDDDSRDISWLGWNITRETDLKVIGNIYENPELLK